MNRTIVYECSCGGEGLSVSSSDWDGYKEIEVSFWNLGHCGRSTSPWRYRLEHIWNILRYGRPYSDMVTLKLETARELANKILEEVGD